jgi:hypothetical protein
MAKIHQEVTFSAAPAKMYRDPFGNISKCERLKLAARTSYRSDFR